MAEENQEQQVEQKEPQLQASGGKLLRPTKKSWDEMDETERRAEFARMKEAEALADRPDPTFDREVDGLVKKMEKIFKGQKRYMIMLPQVTAAQKAAGMGDMPPRECGVNGYNFIVPRNVPVEVPETLIRILYEAGEVGDMMMFQYGLITKEELMKKRKITMQEANKLAELGGVLTN